MYEQTGVLQDCVKEAKALDYAFVVSRQDQEERVGWTEFSMNMTNNNPEITAVCFMPLILNPAHENMHAPNCS